MIHKAEICFIAQNNYCVWTNLVPLVATFLSAALSLQLNSATVQSAVLKAYVLHGNRVYSSPLLLSHNSAFIALCMVCLWRVWKNSITKFLSLMGIWICFLAAIFYCSSWTAAMAGIFSRSFWVTATLTVITPAAGPVILTFTIGSSMPTSSKDPPAAPTR